MALPLSHSCDRMQEYAGSYLQMVYCTWCGAKLPESKREAYFDRLEELEVEQNPPEVPAELQDASWWGGPAAPTESGRAPDFRREFVPAPKPGGPVTGRILDVS